MDINLEKLPSIPHILVKLLELFNDPDVDLIQVSKIIQQDPSLLSKILTICNSAAYAHCCFEKFEHMLVVLGMDSVKSITITAAVQQFFSQFNNDSNGYISQFWISSLNAAFFAKAIAKIINYPHPEEAYFGGLIHQIGKLIFLSHSYQEYTQIIDNCHTAEDIYDKENKVFNLSSADLGAQLIRSWKLNSVLDDAVLYQQAPIYKLFDSHLLIRIINLSHSFCLQTQSLDNTPSLENTHGFENSGPEFFDHAYKLFGLSQAVIEDIFVSVEKDVEKTALSLAIKLNQSKNKIANIDAFCLSLASQVKHIAIRGSIAHQKPELKAQQVITNLMQNIHIIFGLSRCLYFSYDPPRQLLECNASNMDSTFDLTSLYVPVSPEHKTSQTNEVEVKRVPSLLTKSFNNKAITSSFEHQSRSSSASTDSLVIIDQQILRKLQSDGMLCIPLFYKQKDKQRDKQRDKPNYKEIEKTDFFGILVVAVSAKQYPRLLEQRSLIAEFTRTASGNIKQIKTLNEQHQDSLDNASKQQKLHIRKLIHEANNPLAIITNYLHILSIKMHTGESVQTNVAADNSKTISQIETLQEEVERVGHILLRMKEPPEYCDNSVENTDINGLVNDLISVFHSSLFQTNQGQLTKIQEIVTLDQSIPLISCDRNSLKQVLINLIKNSVEALSDAKTEAAVIEIETHDMINMNAKQYVEITISDNGPGMDTQVLEHLFSPVQTSKGENHSGLGLSICKNIIDQLGGMISCSSHSGNKQNQGVKFVILLPRNNAIGMDKNDQ